MCLPPASLAAFTTPCPIYRPFQTTTSKLSRHPPRACAARPHQTAEDLITHFWSISSQGSFSDTLPLFIDSAVYHDTFYPAPFIGRTAIAGHLRTMQSVIPPGLTFVLDDLAPAEYRVGARWHVETRAGRPVPFSRGASMYSLVEEHGELRISEVWDFIETPFKAPGLLLPVLSFVAWLLRMVDKGRVEQDHS